MRASTRIKEEHDAFVLKKNKALLFLSTPTFNDIFEQIKISKNIEDVLEQYSSIDIEFFQMAIDQVKPEQEITLIDEKYQYHYKKINGLVFLFDSSLSIVEPSIIHNEINMLEKMYLTIEKLNERINNKEVFNKLSSLEQKYATLEVENFKKIYYTDSDEIEIMKKNIFIKNKNTYFKNYDENSYQTAERLNLWFNIL